MKKRMLLTSLIGLAIGVVLLSCSKEEGDSFNFRCYMLDNNYESKAYYNDDYFKNPSTEYNASLSTLSCQLCIAITPDLDEVSNDKILGNAKSMFESMGYKDIWANSGYFDYATEVSQGTIFANKKIGEKTMVCLSTKGFKYGSKEWANNMILGDNNSDAEGLKESSLTLLNDLKTYIGKYNIKGDIMLWASGYSRAGALAYLLTSALDNAIYDDIEIIPNVTIKKEDIYTYTYESPKAAGINNNPRDEKYNNIFNIVNPNDFITYIAPEDLGFQRYGTDIVLSSSFTDKDYMNNISRVKEICNNLVYVNETGGYILDQFVNYTKDYTKTSLISSINDTNKYNYPLGIFMKDLFEGLFQYGINDRTLYVNYFQKAFSSVLETVTKDLSKTKSLQSYFLVLVLNGRLNQIVKSLEEDFNNFSNEAMPIIEEIYNKLGSELDDDTKDSIKYLLDVIKNMIINNDNVIPTFANINNLKVIVSGHFPDVVLAHLMSMDPNYSTLFLDYDTKGEYYRIELDLNNYNSFDVKDSFGNILCSVNNKELVLGGIIPYSINHSNIFECYIPKTYNPYIEGDIGDDSIDIEYHNQNGKNIITVNNASNTNIKYIL